MNDLSKGFELSKQFNFEKSVQSVSSLVAMLSHEIKNPLTPIQLTIDNLKSKYQKFFTEDDKDKYENSLKSIKYYN